MQDYKFDDFDSEPLPEKRNTFLTVLCILTFIGSGWGLISSGIAYTSAGKTVQLIKDSTNLNPVDTVKLDTSDGEVVVDTANAVSKVDSATITHEADSVDRPHSVEVRMKKSLEVMLTKENIEQKAIADFISALLTLTGAILMWFLRKSGFFLYVLGIAISIAIPFYLYGNDFLAVGMSMVGPFFGVVFIALYALNLKTMRK